MILSKEQVIELSGYRRPSCQIKWLKRQGLRFFVAGDGYPRVPESSLSCSVERPEAPGARVSLVAQARDWFSKNVPGCLLSPDQIMKSRAKFEWAPNTDGIYFLFHEDLIIYVGQSRSIHGRLLQHHTAARYGRSDMRFSHYTAIEVHPFYLDSIETFYISFFEPYFNVHPGKGMEPELKPYFERALAGSLWP